MKNNFSKRVQMVIQFSREEALRLGHNYIGAEHLLLGIIRQGDGLAVEILSNLGVELDELKQSLEDAVRTSGGTMTLGNLPLTKRAEKILKSTYDEAKNFKSDFSEVYSQRQSNISQTDDAYTRFFCRNFSF